MNEKFEKARSAVVFNAKEDGGFGTFSEKSTHAVLKRYIEPNTDYHEVGLCGSIADIFRDGNVYEIQTRDMYKLVPKLDKFLENYQVTIVFPISNERKIFTVNRENASISKPRKSPKKGSIYNFLPEVYGVRKFFGNKNLSFKIMLMNVLEYRTNTPEKHGRCKTKKYDIVPECLICEINIKNMSDFIKFLPPNLPEIFGSKDYALSTGLSLSDARISLNVLLLNKVIERIDKKERSFLYKIIE